MDGSAPYRQAAGQPMPSNQPVAVNAQNDTHAVAQQFHSSPLVWSGYLPVTTAPPQALWLQRLPAGYIRGDGCFQHLMGAGVSLLCDDNQPNLAFLHSRRCPESLRHMALVLAADMQTRNWAVDDMVQAEADLQVAESALRAATDAPDVAVGAAQRNGLALDEERLRALDAAISTASDAVVKARARHDETRRVLGTVQQNLVTKHEGIARILQLTPEERPRTAQLAAYLAGEAPQADPPEDQQQDLPLHLDAVLERAGVRRVELDLSSVPARIAIAAISFGLHGFVGGGVALARGAGGHADIQLVDVQYIALGVVVFWIANCCVLRALGIL